MEGMDNQVALTMISKHQGYYIHMTYKRVLNHP